ncbi:MAG: DUF1127 domain-containing protein [Alphaproteobacteria bacterium]|nr:DUF1127 domain-containing protein [Alphaproteobacteria bacterium]NUQ33420.1 DUF1127 domain-containing protein [Planctomycetaceae bacterium]
MLHPLLSLGPAPVPVARTPSRRPGSLAVRFFDTLFDWMDRYRSRRALFGMTDAQLNDVGLTRADIHAEAGKPFWRQ